MRNILLIIYLSLTPIFVATAATDIDSMECVLAKMPSGDRLVKLDELASDKKDKGWIINIMRIDCSRRRS